MKNAHRRAARRWKQAEWRHLAANTTANQERNGLGLQGAKSAPVLIRCSVQHNAEWRKDRIGIPGRKIRSCPLSPFAVVSRHNTE